MTDLAVRSDRASGVGSADAIPAEVVRKLVAWSQREIDILLEELDEALREAEAAEREVPQRPVTADPDVEEGAPASTTALVDHALPATPEMPALNEAEPAPEDWPIDPLWPIDPSWPIESSVSPAPTTVVARPDAPGSQETELSAEDGATPTPKDRQVSPTRSEMVRRHGRKAARAGRLRDHWVMAAGIAAIVVGLALVVLG